jgi:protein-S-isoprenylcysteine O-methyltransferase Ste14
MTNLISKTITGFLFLMFMLGLAVFIPAGSLSYWQAWVYLAVWALCVILITAYLIKNDQTLLAGRVKAGPGSETQRSQQIIQSLASLFFISLFIVPGLDFRFHWSDVLPALSLIADGCVVLGFLIVFMVFKENSFTRGTIEVSAEQKVITSGPYRMVRHPMYAGALFMLTFTPLALGSLVAIPLALPMILIIAVRLLDEERFLTNNLAGYREYCQKVRYHLIPFVW